MNKAEFEAPIAHMAFNVALTAALLCLVVSLSMYFWWRQKRAEYETENARAELNQQILKNQVGFLSKYASDALFLMKFDGEIVDANERAESMYGYCREELVGMNMNALRDRADPVDHEAIRQKLLEEKMFLAEAMHRRKDGSVFPVEVSMGLIQTSDGLFMQELVRDISKRKQVEEALRVSQTRLSLLFQNMTNGFALHEGVRDENGQINDYRFLNVNPAFEKMTGLQRENILGKTAREVIPDIEERWIKTYTDVMETGESRHFEGYSSVLKKWFSVHAYSPDTNQFVTMVEDISIRKETEQRVQRLMDLYHALSEINDAIIHLKDPAALYQIACRIAVEQGGVMLAWVGMLDESGDFIVPSYRYGEANGYLEGLQIPVSPDEIKGKGPVATTFREAHAVIVNDFDTVANTLPWHARAKEFGIRASASFPIKNRQLTCAVFTVYSHLHDVFDDEIVALLGEIAGNLSFAIENVEREIQRKQTEHALRQSEARLQRVAEEAPFPMMVIGEDGDVLQVNKVWTEITGYTLADIPTFKIWSQRAYGSKVSDVDDGLDNLLNLAKRYDTGERVVRCKNGELRTWHFISAPLGRLPDDRRYILSMATDVTESKKAEEALRLAATVFESSHSAIVITDSLANIVAVNPAFTRITGYTEDEVIHGNPRLLHSGRQGKDFYEAFWKTLLEEDSWQGEIWNCRKNGEEYAAWLSISAIRDEHGVIQHYIGIADDITENKAIQRQMEYLAYHDSLTGLPNRMLANDRLEQAIAHANRSKNRVAVMFLDLDDFKTINDTLGHSVGDSMLKSVAERLQACVRESDTVSRLGGDEFLVMLHEVSEIEAINRVAVNILEKVHQSCRVGDHELTTSTSIGIAVFPEDGTDRDTLLKNADMAMYNAKQSGRNTHRFFAEEMNEYVLEHLLIRNGLTRALDNDEFLLYFQPVLDLMTGKPIGAEALIRWRHPELGMIPPSRFIQVAEDTGMIVPIGNWVMQEACRQARSWQEAGWPLRVAVNISAVQFRRGDLEETVAHALQESGLPSDCLELELTESILIQDINKTLEVLHRLGKLGVHLSIDDFGTGYSSLAYLRRLPVDKLKIDRSFVNEITTRPDDAAIALSIITLAQSLRKRVIAEGVETPEQLRFLQEHGCNEIQGYLFSRPLDAEAFGEFLSAGMKADFLAQLA